jgi:hypothetical protein
VNERADGLCALARCSAAMNANRTDSRAPMITEGSDGSSWTVSGSGRRWRPASVVRQVVAMRCSYVRTRR